MLGIRLTNMMLFLKRAGASSAYKPIRKLTSHFWRECTSLTRDLGGRRKQTSHKCSCASVPSSKYQVFCCDQNGPPARREEGAYLNRYVTDEQRRRPFSSQPFGPGPKYLVFPGQDARANHGSKSRSNLPTRSCSRRPEVLPSVADRKVGSPGRLR
jgi:hypothetical protein